ncbi:MAG: magnesium/cobalt transporter CorA [Desulfobacterales bacterium]|uniref:Magnesium transport protein CorA n=1 Tax=Candidatus Desulfatibia vada TaxID=2841696 RepID=A0A8J6P4V1_9BACT|nr:magnesium/cobalt transporter CorA [Candidatus Desulfatibia vada]MBL6971627.1 magnesium/cobalt transporter CorA [Desulfobacterales bacterium]
MLKFTKKVSKKSGTAPGTLVHIGEKKTDRARITVVDYVADQLREQELEIIEDAFPFKDFPTTTWLNIDGMHDIELIEKIGRHFNIHPLTLEDIVNTGQRPKVEEFADYIYLVLKMLHVDKETDEIRSEQVSLVVGNNFLISFQEAPGDVFEPVRERIRKGRGRIRKSGVDYLAYALIDAVVDHYFVILETVGATIESLEEDLLAEPTADTMQSIHDLKRELIYLRKQVWPIREVINTVAKGELTLMQEDTGVFFRDVYDHTIQIVDTIESYRDVLSGMLDLYLSTVSNRMNEVMKVLTIMATIFIPITFVAGIYGMNFKYMPELDWKWGYPAVWSLIGGTVLGMIFFFKRKKWL